MKSFNIFSLAKSNGETWFEHSKSTFHLGRILWNLCEEKISKYFTKDQYLWCCLFHDIGKTVWKGFGDKHTPYTKAVFKNIRGQKEYENLLEQFELPDFTEDQRLIKAIEDHHDNKIKGSEFITLADCIASSDFGYLSEMDTGTYAAYLKFLISDMQEVQEYYLNKITFPESSYLDRVKFGQLFLTKMLRESVWKFCETEDDTYYLFDIKNGCKILTKTRCQNLADKIKASFSEYLLDRFDDFPILQLIGGQPQSTFRLRQYVFPEKHNLVLEALFQSCLIEGLGNIGRKAKIKQIPNKYEMEDWDKDFLVKTFSEYTGLDMERLEKIKDYDSSWMGFENNDKTLLLENFAKLKNRKPEKINKDRIERLISSFKKGLEERPTLESIFLHEQIIDKNSIYTDCWLEAMAKYFIRKNSFLRSAEKHPDLTIAPLLSFVAINDQLPYSIYSNSTKDICASCGTFLKYMEAGPVVTGFSKQQWREAIGAPESPQPLCPLCYFSLLIYTYLTGTEKGQNIRPLDTMYFSLIGINILNDIEQFIKGNSLFEEEITKRLDNFKKQYNLEETIVYIPHQIDLDTVVYSIIPKNETYKQYPSLQKYSILSEIRDLVSSSEGILGISLQEKPEIKGPFIIKTQEGEINLKEIEAEIDLFNFIRDITYEPKTLIFYFRLWHHNPVLTLSRIIKDNNTQGKKVYLSKENLERGVIMMPEDDQNFQLARELWQIVRILGQLPSGRGSKYEVGKPVKKFKGTPESLDYHMNFLLKDAKIGAAAREEALGVASKLRERLSKLDSKQQKELANYVKKTTHLFSALAWQEVKSKGGSDNEQT